MQRRGLFTTDSPGWTLVGPWVADTTASGSAWTCGISGVEVVTEGPRSPHRERRERGSVLSVAVERASRSLDVGRTRACSSRTVNPASGCGALGPTVERSASPADWCPGRSHRLRVSSSLSCVVIPLDEWQRASSIISGKTLGFPFCQPGLTLAQ